MNDIVLKGFVTKFAEARGLSHLQWHEQFEQFVATAILRKYHQAEIADIEDGFLVGGSEDGGLDAVAILVNGRPARTEEDVEYFVNNLRRFEVEFVFVQAKTSPSFKAADIGTFVFGVEQFFNALLSLKPRVKFNSQVQQLVNLTRDIYEQAIKMQDNPKCYLYYATAGKWDEAPNPRGRLKDGEDVLRKKEMFSSVKSTPVDAELLKSVYRELERGVVKVVEFGDSAVFPEIDEVDEAYIGLLRGDEFIEMISTDEGELNRELFYENVRDFQGHNSVNSEINETLAEEPLRRKFPLLNNGVTIVARRLHRKANTFTISDFQIVNGCQTSHILFQNRPNINESTFIPVKLVATSDTQLINEVIKATNRQTAVLPEALESLTPFHKELEDFYVVREERRDFIDRIYYERRSRQYFSDDISLKNIVSLSSQIKSFIGMFLDDPHSNPGNYVALLKSYEGRIFAEDHKPAPYYASGASLLAVDKWINSRPERRKLREYKYHLLMLLKFAIGGKKMPRLTDKAITDFSLKIIDELRDQERCEVACMEAAELLRATLEKFGTPRKERNPPYRLKVFTERLLQNISANESVQSAGVTVTTEQLENSGFEGGRIRWFDEWRNYGFIERDLGGDIFVHGSQIGKVPWHLRSLGKRVHFRAGKNPRSPERVMAIDVRLENS
ncbi:MAG: AIPR family protein [Caldilineaceae bacterium]|nr:AIPR family protein [Caldilineaceae bacterium]